MSFPSDQTHFGIAGSQISAMMDESLTWEPHVLQHYQRFQLSQLLHHAKQNVPYYERRFGRLFDQGGSIDWTRWEDVPILTRKELRDHGDLLLSKVQLPLHGPIHTASSSGSTGIPITVKFPSLFAYVANLAWSRFYTLHGVAMHQGYVDFHNSLPKDAAPGSHCYLNNKVENSFLILRNLTSEEKLKCLGKSPFKVLRDMPNHAEILARTNLRQQTRVQLDYVVCVGMPVTQDQRTLIAESFGAICISPYSSKEGSLIAFECSHGDHFHNCAELMLLEIVDESGHSVQTGCKGRCVITPFFNSAQPLIRYEQGDILISGSPCVGGITLPVIEKISGRQDTIFRLPNRDVAVIGLDVSELRKLMNADAFQLAQTGPETIEVRYIAKNNMSTFATNEMIARLEIVFGLPLELKFKRMDDIPANAGGKQQRFVREFE